MCPFQSFCLSTSVPVRVFCRHLRQTHSQASLASAQCGAGSVMKGDGRGRKLLVLPLSFISLEFAIKFRHIFNQSTDSLTTNWLTKWIVDLLIGVQGSHCWQLKANQCARLTLTLRRKLNRNMKSKLHTSAPLLPLVHLSVYATSIRRRSFGYGVYVIWFAITSA